MDTKYDEELLKNGDNRNVIDKYRNWHNEAIKNDLLSKSSGFHVAIENFQHDFNIGAVVRNANAFNAKSVHIIGKRKWNRRGAMSTEKYLNLYHHSDIEDFNEWSKTNKLPIIGIDNIKGSIDLSKTVIPKDCVLVFGQEGPGLSPEMQDICQEIIAIEQFGSTRSINVGVASGIIMYAWINTWVFNK